MIKADKMVTLYLAEWQRRMLKDNVKAANLKSITLSKITKVGISIIDRKQWVMYRQPIDKIKGWNLYLTDEQIKIVKEKTGLRTGLSALYISPELLSSGAVVFG